MKIPAPCELYDAFAAMAEVEIEPPLIATLYNDEAELVGCVVGLRYEQDGHAYALLEYTIVRPKFRGKLSNIRALRDRWFALCRERGYTQMVTRIEKKRSNVAQLGERIAGYKYFAEDEEYRWFYRDIPR